MRAGKLSGERTRPSRVGVGAPGRDRRRILSRTQLAETGIQGLRRRPRKQPARRVRSPKVCTLALGFFALFALHCRAAEVIPPKPDRYFNDYAGVVSRDAALRFNEQLAQFERETSNQIVVAVFPKMQTDSDIADYTQRVAKTWGVGQKDRRNGAVLFVFITDRKMFIQVGYGLEGALPDATCFDITEFRIKPHFRAQDYEGGLAVGIQSMLQAVRGEYKGTGKTVRERQTNKVNHISGLVWFIIFIVIIFLMLRRGNKRGYTYSSTGGPFIGGWSGGSGGGWSSGGGGGGFSGFSGGGGSFGGGGAGSDW